jgi:peptidoglycan/xylan/chitin deacetylase (PgdA/CDA1 family)
LSFKRSIELLLSQALQPIYGGAGHVLMFHRICPPPARRIPGASMLNSTPEFLEAVIQFFLERKYDFLSPPDLPQRLLRPRGRRRFVVFSFDDGYLDNLTLAYPIFQKYDLPFTIHIASGYQDGTACLWRFPLEELVLCSEHLSVRVDGQPLELDCSDLPARQRSFTLLRRALKSSTPRTLQGNLEGIFAPHGIDPVQSTHDLLLSWEQISRLGQDERVTLGAHSANHYMLSRLSDEELHHEITLSKCRLEECLGRAVTHFAYPFGGPGEADGREFRAVMEAGFETAFTTRAANIFPQHIRHLTALPRFDVPGLGSLEKLALSTNGLIPARRYRFKRVIVK